MISSYSLLSLFLLLLLLSMMVLLMGNRLGRSSCFSSVRNHTFASSTDHATPGMPHEYSQTALYRWDCDPDGTGDKVSCRRHESHWQTMFS